MIIIHLILGKARLDRMNGVNKVAHNLALHQAQKGHEVFIWGITPTLDAKLEPRPYEIRLFQAQQNKLHLDPTLVNAIKQLNPKESYFHIHGSFITEFFWVARHLARRDIPYAYCPHGSLSPGALQRQKMEKEILPQLD